MCVDIVLLHVLYAPVPDLQEHGEARPVPDHLRDPGGGAAASCPSNNTDNNNQDM